jgi:L-threonylcarbamoyladenylate synthase
MAYVDFNQAVELLRGGHAVALPTETVYGLAGSLESPPALRSIFQIKKRPFFDPLIVHVFSADGAKACVAEFPEPAIVLAEAFWPGPLTFVLPKKRHVPDVVTAGLETVAVRVPRHPLMRKILAKLNVPLAAPSANMFGKTSPTTAAHVEDEFQSRVPVLDGGSCDVGVESTVIGFKKAQGKSWTIQLLRPGGISRQQIERALLEHKVTAQVVRTDSKASPGSLKIHYQPTSPLVVVDSGSPQGDLLSRINQSLRSDLVGLVTLELGADAALAARTLYGEMRRCSQPGQGIVVFRGEVNLAPEWEAIWDRIERASSLTLDETKA